MCSTRADVLVFLSLTACWCSFNLCPRVLPGLVNVGLWASTVWDLIYYSWSIWFLARWFRVLITAILWAMVGCDWKSRYLSAWVGLLYTLVARVLSGFRITSTSRKASWASDFQSAVNWIVVSMVLMWRWKSSTWWALRAQQVSSTYCFQNVGGWGYVERELDSMSSMSKSAATIETGDPMAVQWICW